MYYISLRPLDFLLPGDANPLEQTPAIPSGTRTRVHPRQDSIRPAKVQVELDRPEALLFGADGSTSIPEDMASKKRSGLPSPSA
jgi:hypothetical protein